MKTNQVVFITGASSGIGKATALQLIQEGMIVYGAARRMNQMEDLAKSGGHALEMDVTNESQVQSAVAQIIAEQGRIDVLINNAGYGLYGAVEDAPLEAARRQFEVNLFGLAAVTKAVIPHMRSRKQGKIINISSMGGKVYMPLGAWYHASKHALEGWSDCLRLELAAFGIDVVIIEPGIIATEFGDVMTDPMMEISGNGAYAPLAKAVAKSTKDSYAKGGASPAGIISDLISRAIRSPRPKTRYATGKFAKPLMFVRRYFSDRVYDKIIMSQIK